MKFVVVRQRRDSFLCADSRALIYQRYRDLSVSFGIFCSQFFAPISTTPTTTTMPTTRLATLKHLASTFGGQNPPATLPLFRLLQPSLSPTLRVPEAASKELSYPRATLIFHPHHPSRPPHPLYVCLCLLSTLGAHTVTRNHAANTCSCLPLQSYGSEDDVTHSTRNYEFV